MFKLATDKKCKNDVTPETVTYEKEINSRQENKSGKYLSGHLLIRFTIDINLPIYQYAQMKINLTQLIARIIIIP